MSDQMFMTHAYAVGGAIGTVAALSIAYTEITANGTWLAVVAPIGMYAFAQFSLRLQIRKGGGRPRRSALWFVP